ncbi:MULTISPECIES: hypothetical protein [unclassified Mucilaginibacter]|uniref:hypothetical protein n=1 Tax=unclassified Mucilaginibacter TaxID=2617802 RepID=UPI002AC99239|nr:MULTISPECIES: hypothetical protein [unclassified Mucilaginibacter]MEB0280396.1 hypothetical protein [Mucilaginibacter sp. 10B2]WPX24513.1 hypothetical protein RHM67_04400 [Mucilaginibacter sp. 5C4]
MLSSLVKEKPEVRLRAFRAVDEPETCALFIEGHTHVLTSIGITKVTSSKNEWTTNPSSFVMVVESLDGKVVYGGARVHVAGGTQQLPIEQATGAMDAGVFGLVWQYAQQGTGELCGLWNSRQIAGYGIGSIFLIRTAVAIAYQIGIQSLFALCAPYTIPPGVAVGMEYETTIGENGTFYYPKLDLVATTMLLKDVPVLSKAYEEDKIAIMKIRDNQKIIRTEILRKKEITIHYDIEIQNLKQWDLSVSIAQAKTNYLNSKISDQDPNII